MIEKYKKLVGEEYSFEFEFSVNGWSKINIQCEIFIKIGLSLMEWLEMV